MAWFHDKWPDYHDLIHFYLFLPLLCNAFGVFSNFHKFEYLFRYSLELWVHFQISEVLTIRFPVALPVRAAIQSSAAHTDIAHLTAWVFFGVCGGKAHELVMAADLSEYAVLQKQGLCVQHL